MRKEESPPRLKRLSHSFLLDFVVWLKNVVESYRNGWRWDVALNTVSAASADETGADSFT